MLRPLPTLGLAALLGGQWGCPEGPPLRTALDLRAPEREGAVEPQPSPEPEPELPPTAVARRMHEQLSVVTRIQQATIRGDIGLAQAAGAELTATLAAEPPPESWRPHLGAMHEELAALAQADEDLPTTGQAVARLGLGCGRCHEAMSVELVLPELPAPSPGPGLDSAMQVHRWAADRMWEGLVGPAGDRWIRGSTMFILIPGCDETMVDRAPEDRARCQRAQNLARRGHVTESLDARAEIYGRLLTTCAQCHVAARSRAPR